MNSNVKDRIFDIVLGILLVLTPIVFVPWNIPRLNGWVASYQYYQFNMLNIMDIPSIQLLFFELAVVILLVVATLSNQHRGFKDKPISLLFILVLLNLMLHPIGIKVFPFVLLGFLLYYLIVCYIKDVRTIAYPMLIVSALNTVFAVMQALGIYLVYNTIRCDGAMFISNHMALYQAISIPMVYMLSPWLVLIPIIGLLLSSSIVPLVASLIGMMFLLRRNNLLSIPMLGIYGGLGLYLIYLYKGLIYKLSIRSQVWLQSIDFSFFGHKLGSFSSAIPTIGNSTTTYSIYLTIYYYLGIVGIITLSYFFIDRIIRYRKSKVSKPFECLFASVVILALCGLSQSFLDFPRLAFTSIVMLAGLSAFLMKGEVANGND